MGSRALTNGELAIVAEDTPNNDAIGLAQTPTHAPLLQQDSSTGAADDSPPVIVVQIDFFCFIIIPADFIKRITEKYSAIR